MVFGGMKDFVETKNIFHRFVYLWRKECSCSHDVISKVGLGFRLRMSTGENLFGKVALSIFLPVLHGLHVVMAFFQLRAIFAKIIFRSQWL